MGLDIKLPIVENSKKKLLLKRNWEEKWQYTNLQTCSIQYIVAVKFSKQGAANPMSLAMRRT